MAKPKKIYTLESLKEKTIEVGECWEWQGAFGNKVPHVYHAGNLISVRRLFTQLLDKKTPEHGFLIPSCNNRICVNPDHTRWYSKAQFYKRAGNRSAKSPTRAVKIQIYKRAHHAKLDETKAAHIRNSDMPSREMAQLYGICKSLVCKIRAGRAWVNLSNNPFAGLMR